MCVWHALAQERAHTHIHICVGDQGMREFSSSNQKSAINLSHLGAQPKSETAQLKGTAISQGPLREDLVRFPNFLKIVDYTSYLHLMAQELKRGWNGD